MSQDRPSTPSETRAKGSSDSRRPRNVVVNDLMQRGFEYALTEPAGRNFASGFEPQLAPQELLELGVFGGRYMTDCVDEFPVSWFANAKLCHDRHDASLNYFRVNASQPLALWRAKGWIHPDDPRGWFQWYCRYWMGRRHEDDERQIARWRAISRHASQLQSNCPPRALDCRPRQRQALLHWAYDSRAI